MRERQDKRYDQLERETRERWDMVTWMAIVLVVSLLILLTWEIWLPHGPGHLE